MTGRHGGPAPAVRGDLRAAHADRERVVAALQAAFVQGRLDKDELAARVGQALASRTYAELAALTADLPAAPGYVPSGLAAPGYVPSGLAAPGYVPSGLAATGPAAVKPARTPAQTMARAAYRSAIFLLMSVALVEGAFLTGFGGFLVMAVYTFVAFSGFLGYGVVDAWHERRARRPPPPAVPGRA